MTNPLSLTPTIPFPELELNYSLGQRNYATGFDRPRRQETAWSGRLKRGPDPTYGRMYAGRGHTQQSRRTGKADGFATIIEPAWEGSSNLVSPSCVEKGQRPRSDPRSSKGQRAVLWPRGTAGARLVLSDSTLSVSAPAPELGLSAGSKLQIRSR
jgi:hypothetical protein